MVDVVASLLSLDDSLVLALVLSDADAELDSDVEPEMDSLTLDDTDPELESELDPVADIDADPLLLADDWFVFRCRIPIRSSFSTTRSDPE